MSKTRRLLDVYRFPGFEPCARVHAIFGLGPLLKDCDPDTARFRAMAAVSPPMPPPMTIAFSTDHLIRVNVRTCLFDPGPSESRSSRWTTRSPQTLWRWS